MNYKTILTVSCLLAAFQGRAQGSRIANMLKQLAALKEYELLMNNGYSLASQGLLFLHEIRSGEFLLHQTYFTSLLLVDEGILDDPALHECYDLLGRCRTAAREAGKKTDALHPNEQDAVARTIAVIENRCQHIETTLALLTKNEALSMTDGDRLKAVHQIEADLSAIYIHALRFASAIPALIAQREKEKASINTLKQLYELP